MYTYFLHLDLRVTICGFKTSCDKQRCLNDLLVQ